MAQVLDTLKVAQPADTLTIEQDTTGIQDTLIAPPEEKEREPVIPWKERHFSQSELITTDSLLRWQIWPNWGDHQAYRKDVISFYCPQTFQRTLPASV